ncbi:MAG: tripartite tricarboxylate transporter substrate binding protein [Betaproteobacteria bacterium]
MSPIGRFFFATALAAIFSANGFAQSYPTRPIKLVVAQAAGGQTDVVARMVTQRLSEILKQPVVVENRGGVGGTIGADYVAKAPADGYTILVGGPSNLAIAVALFKSLPYDPVRDFVPIGGVARVPYALAVNSKVPAKTIEELVSYARAHPGRLTYASAGNGSNSNLASELFKSMAGIDIVEIPYKGSAPGLADLVGGQVDIMFTDLSLILPHARAGTLRLLAGAGDKRSASLPDLPTMGEQGFPGFAIEPWYGLLAPAGVPPAIIGRLDEALAQVLRSDEIRQRILQHGYEPIDESPAAMGASIRSDIAKYSILVRNAGIKVE